MGSRFKRGFAWFCAGYLVIGSIALIWGFLADKDGHLSPWPGIAMLLFGSLWCAYLYGSGVNNRNMANEAQLQHERDQQALELAMQSPLQEVRPRQALIKPDEKAYATIDATLLEEKTVGYSAGTRGMSVHVAKGVTLRTSGTRAMPIKDMVEVARGELVITDKRVIFAGDRKSFFLANADLINTTNYTDGFGFTDGNKTYTLKTLKGPVQGLFAVALQKVLRS